MRTITTIITTFNHEKFIAQAIESALAQKGDFQHEILISDDASTDGTRDVIREYAARYPDVIRDISNNSNIGISANMQKCFFAATGDYIAILEGDDYWTDEAKLAKQAAFLDRHESCSMVFSRIRLNRDGEFSFLPRHDRMPELIYNNDILETDDLNPICNFSCCLFRGYLIRGLPDFAYEGRLSEVTVAFYLVQAGALGYMNECMSDYRIHAHGVYSGAKEEEKIRQALQTFRTTRRVANIDCWAKLTDVIESLKCALDDLVSPRLSIVTIAYNNLEGLKRTAESVAAQTSRDFEWIVIDGGSTDGSKEFLSKCFPQPTYWVSEPDGGLYDAMNKGVRAAKGAYVIAMNSGDVFHSSDTVEKVLASGLRADVVYGDWFRVYPDREEFCKAPNPLPPFYFFQEGCNICQQAMFVRTQILQNSPFATKYRIASDWAKWRTLLLEGCSFAYVPVAVCNFEAGTGVSERPSYLCVNDTLWLRGDFPVGVIEQSLRLKDVLQRHEAYVNQVNRLHDRSLYRLAQFLYDIGPFLRKSLSRARRLSFDGWRCFRAYGIQYTWLHFWGLVGQYSVDNRILPGVGRFLIRKSGEEGRPRNAGPQQ